MSIVSMHLGIFLIPLAVNLWGLNIYADAKISWFLIFIGIALLGTGAALLTKKQITFPSNKQVWIFIGLFLLSGIISTVTAVAPIESLFGSYTTKIGLITYALLVIHFLYCFNLFQDKKKIAWFFGLTKILALVISVHAILQYFNIDPLVDVDNKQFLFRVYGTIGQPNFLGQFLIFPCFILLFSVKNLWQKKKYQKVFWEGLILALVLTTLFLTKNRATWLALLGSGYLMFVMLHKSKPMLKTAVTLTAGALGSALLLFQEISMRSIDARLLLWEGATKIVDWSNALFGSGLNAFYQTFTPIMPQQAFEYEEFYKIPTSPHSEILQTLLERGVFGLMLYLIPIIFLIYLAYKKKIKTSTQKTVFFALITYLISVQFSFSTIEHFIFLATFWAILLTQTITFKPVTLKIKHFLPRLPVAAITIALASVILCFSFCIVQTDYALKKGLDQYLSNPETAFDEFETAIDAAPYFAYPRKLAIDFFDPLLKDNPYIAQGLKQYLEEFGAITNYNFQYHILAMRIYAAENNMANFEEHLKKAEALTPNLPLLHTTAGDAYFEKGNCEKAVQHYEKLLSLAPRRYLDHQENCSEIDTCRIFRNNASAFVFAMQNLDACTK